MPDLEAPAEQDQPTDAVEQPTEAQPTDSMESFTDFDPSSLPEEARQAVETAQKRMQADYTRKTQSLAEERRKAEEAIALQEALDNPEMLPHILKLRGYDLNDPQVLGMLGYELAEAEEDDQEWVDPSERTAQEVQQLRAEIQQDKEQQAAQQQETAVEEFIADGIEKLESSEEPFNESEIAYIRHMAVANPDVRGYPNVKGAVESLNKMLEGRKQNWVESKKTQRAPASGSDANPARDPNRPRATRLQEMTEAAEVAERDDSV